MRVVLFGSIIVAVVLMARYAIGNLEAPPSPLANYQLEPELVSDGNQFRMNGALMQLDVGESDKSPDALMAELTAKCEQGKLESDQLENVVACQQQGLAYLANALTDFTTVEAMEGGGSKYMKLTSKDTLGLAQLMPMEGDAAGFDIKGVPRPEGLKRYMSFEDPTGQYQSVQYGGGEKSAKDTLLWFSAQLEKAGWTIIQAAAEDEHPHLFADHAGTLLLVQTRPGCEGICLTANIAW